jgi:methionyl-tRNA formyltransferase
MNQPDFQQRPQIVFFGSGPVAAKSLELLLEWCDVEAVITKPQPPHHKEPFPVLETAARHDLKALTPQGRKELSELFASKPVASRIGVVIDYGFIINQDVIDYFPLGIINSHFSLLPEWRGADPITFAILSGQPRTGVSLMRIVAAMDEGPLLAQGEYDITPDETTPSLTRELVHLSDALLKDSLVGYIDGRLKLASQEEVCRMMGWEYQPTYSRKLTKEDSILDFTKPAAQLEREIRAFIEWPKSRTVVGGKDVVITKAYATPDTDPQAQAGGISADKAAGVIRIQTSDGSLCVERLKPAGKPEMSAMAFLAGNTL